MSDIEAILVEFLKNTDLWTQLDGRIYAGDQLPAGYKPSEGPAILITMQNKAIDYSELTATSSCRFTVYGDDATIIRNTEQKLYQSLQNARGGQLLSSTFTQASPVSTRSVMGWPFSTNTYSFIYAN